MNIISFLPFLITLAISGVVYLLIYHLMNSPGIVSGSESNYDLMNQQNRSILNHSDNEKHDLKHSKISDVGSNKNTSEENPRVDFETRQSDSTSLVNISTHNTLATVDYKKHPNDYICLYHKDLLEETVQGPTKITFGYGHNKQCCFPNTLAEFNKNYIDEGILGIRSYGAITKIRTKCCKSRYALKLCRIEYFNAHSNVGYYHVEMYFAKYFQLNPLPHIIKFYQVYYYEGRLYIISELLSNGTLEKINFIGNNYDEKRLEKYIKGIFIAIASLHKHKIVHGDIKRDNIGIDGNDNIKIFDFDLSNKLDSGYANMATQGGAPIHRAPEYLVSNKTVSYQTDWWAFGVVIYILVENRYPFDSKNGSLTGICRNLKKNIESGKFNGFTNEKISEELKDLVKQLLEPNITKRLGVGENAMDEILKHPYFKGKSFEQLLDQY